jgi:phosphohistidine phosphatase
MDTRRLTLLRHGQAESGDGTEDFERALTRRGIADAKEMASRLVRRNLIPDLILYSPAERAWTTASILAAACELDVKQVQGARELYLAAPDTTWHLLAGREAHLKHILVCGHNPGLSELAGRFGPHPGPRELPTAGLVSAVWHADGWAGLEPETASRCDVDEPDNLTDLWVS